MSRAIDRAPARAAVPKPGKAALAVRRFSSLEETKKKATLARMHRITNAIWCMRASVAFFFRSEEHTSELQSQSNLVCRLLLEKKKIIADHPRHVAAAGLFVGHARAAGIYERDPSLALYLEQVVHAQRSVVAEHHVAAEVSTEA